MILPFNLRAGDAHPERCQVGVMSTGEVEMKRPPPSTGGIFSLKNTPELPKLEVIARKNNLVVQEHVSPLQGDRLSHRDPVMEQRERLTLRSFEAGQLAAPLPPPPRANDPELPHHD